MEGRDTGLLIIIGGLVLLALGALVWAGALWWFGRLPGDIRYEGGNTRVYVPITTMILVSVAVSLALYVGRRFF